MKTPFETIESEFESGASVDVLQEQYASDAEAIAYIATLEALQTARDGTQPERAHFDAMLKGGTHHGVTESPYVRFFMWMPALAVAAVVVFVVGIRDTGFDDTIASIVETEVALAEYDDTLIIDNYDDVLDEFIEPLL